MFKPKAIFFGGISGAGKSSYVTLIKSLSKKNFITINSDDFAEPLLAQYDLLKMKSFDEMHVDQKQLEKQTAILMKAKILTAEKIAKVLVKRKNIIIDATSRSIEEIKTKKEELENLGYETFFVLVISELKSAIERNNKRTRSLHPNTIRSMYKQIEEHLKYSNYQTLFKNNYVYINNNSKSSTKDLERMLVSNLPIKDTIDKYNKKVITKILNWIKKETTQNIEAVSKTLSSYLIDKDKNTKFKNSIKKIKDSYQFRV